MKPTSFANMFVDCVKKLMKIIILRKKATQLNWVTFSQLKLNSNYFVRKR